MLRGDLLARLDASLTADDAVRDRNYRGRSTGRQPVHTVYVPADQVHSGLVRRWGTAALDTLSRCGPLPDPLAEQTGRVVQKLTS